MKLSSRIVIGSAACALGLAYFLNNARRSARAEDLLPSWNDGANKRAIIGFVEAVTDEGAPTFVRPAERVATFDNDGTLWSERPLYVQLQFIIERVRTLSAGHPEWRREQPFRAVIEGDRETLAGMNEHDAAALIAATHSGMTAEEFEVIARRWLASAKHPRFGRLYTQCVYQPMLELLGYLRANGFRNCIVSGGGVDFMRAVSEDLYGILPAEVIGSSGKLDFEMRGGKSVLIKLPEVSSIDDKQGKPINIQLHIGQRPLLAFGNSDGDLQMLHYAGGGAGPRLMLLVDHDDAKREYAYRETRLPKLDHALQAADENGWRVVSMKNDWNRIFPVLTPSAADERLAPAPSQIEAQP